MTQLSFYDTVAKCKKCGKKLEFQNKAERIHYICINCFTDETSYITEFKGKYYFLSNFYPAPFIYSNQQWATSEHFYQAMKTSDLTWRTEIRDALTPGQSKRLGMQCPLRNDFDMFKDEIMMKGLMCKFEQNEDIKQKLIATGDAVLVEGNNWGDRYWGVDKVGENVLGKLLMKLRGDFKNDI